MPILYCMWTENTSKQNGDLIYLLFSASSPTVIDLHSVSVHQRDVYGADLKTAAASGCSFTELLAAYHEAISALCNKAEDLV